MTRLEAVQNIEDVYDAYAMEFCGTDDDLWAEYVETLKALGVTEEELKSTWRQQP